ncbi:hypothetical protein M8J76_011506 [Diaphorina citri]|nr:hypothetical protein M8J75_012723 [Diaphorina citri]KAI5714139.1 hypothetical protein M8J76_011506 [Diaphorina citri]KAI5715768.1 hypothetical protein M8J77_022100 [Diaphorina citri]
MKQQKLLPLRNIGYWSRLTEQSKSENPEKREARSKIGKKTQTKNSRTKTSVANSKLAKLSLEKEQCVN